MPYHISDLGTFRHHAQPIADLTGFVPQAGDRREDFGYNGTYDPHYVGDVPWDEFVQSAVEATRDAENDAQAWRDVQAWREGRA